MNPELTSIRARIREMNMEYGKGRAISFIKFWMSCAGTINYEWEPLRLYEFSLCGTITMTNIKSILFSVNVKFNLISDRQNEYDNNLNCSIVKLILISHLHTRVCIQTCWRQNCVRFFYFFFITMFLHLIYFL